MTTKYSQNKLMFTTVSMEKQGSPYKEQVKAVMEHIERCWTNAETKIYGLVDFYRY